MGVLATTSTLKRGVCLTAVIGKTKKRTLRTAARQGSQRGQGSQGGEGGGGRGHTATGVDLTSLICSPRYSRSALGSLQPHVNIALTPHQRGLLLDREHACYRKIPAGISCHSPAGRHRSARPAHRHGPSAAPAAPDPPAHQNRPRTVVVGAAAIVWGLQHLKATKCNMRSRPHHLMPDGPLIFAYENKG